MRILFYLGWVFLVLAFCAAGAEPLLVQVGGGGLLGSTYDLWYTLAPGHLVVTEIGFENNHPALWNGIIRPILYVPGWLLAGVPGALLTWFCRPNRVMTPEVREEYERQKESLFILDELSREARLDESYDPEEDDRAPAHLLFDMEPEEDEDILAYLDEHDIPAGYPAESYVEDFFDELSQDRDFDDMVFDDLGTTADEKASNEPEPDAEHNGDHNGEPKVRIIDDPALGDAPPDTEPDTKPDTKQDKDS